MFKWRPPFYTFFIPPQQRVNVTVCNKSIDARYLTVGAEREERYPSLPSPAVKLKWSKQYLVAQVCSTALTFTDKIVKIFKHV